MFPDILSSDVLTALEVSAIIRKTGNNTIITSIAAAVMMKLFLSDNEVELLIIIEVTITTAIIKKSIIRVTMKEMKRKDRKFPEAELKKRVEVNFVPPFFRLSNNPAVRKAFNTKEMKIKRIKPDERKEARLSSEAPRSAKI